MITPCPYPIATPNHVHTLQGMFDPMDCHDLGMFRAAVFWDATVESDRSNDEWNSVRVFVWTSVLDVCLHIFFFFFFLFFLVVVGVDCCSSAGCTARRYNA